jgi:hypothetical protein
MAVNVSDLTIGEAQWREEGYSCTASYRDVPNHPSKKMFCSYYKPFHSLALMEGAGLMPLEITCHGPTHSINKQLGWSRDTILIKIPKFEPMCRLLVNGLGFHKCEGNIFRLESRFPNWSCNVQVEEGDTQPVSLDDAGFTCLAFYCNRCDDDAQRLLDLSASEYTGSYELNLGERDMMIAMMRAPGGPLLELIAPRRKT